MKLIIIHGPPAAGKLTVATELGRLTGYKVFHNHLSIDCTKPIFEFGSPAFWRVNEHIRTGTIAEAAREGIDLIHTFCYGFGDDDRQYQDIIAATEQNGGEVHSVLLICDENVRKARIGNESRIKIGKLTDPDSIERNRGKQDLEKPLPGLETLIIDTSNVSPSEAAESVIEYYKLVRLEGTV